MKEKTVVVTIAIAISVIAGSYLSWLSSDTPDDPSHLGLDPSVSISPDDQQIVFSYNGAIFVSGIDGSHIKQLTFQEDGRHVNPEFSPDGAHILFNSYPKELTEPLDSLVVMDINGRRLAQIPSEGERMGWATFSQDSKKVCFQVNRHRRDDYSIEYTDVYSVNIDGTDRKQLTNIKVPGKMGNFGAPVDDKELYFIQYDSKGFGKAVFYRLSLDDTPQMTPIHSGEYTGDYRVSPDKKYVVFTGVSQESRSKSPHEYELFVLDMATNQVRQLTTLHGYAESPRFFHHQDKVIFLRNLTWPRQNRRYELMTIDLDGTHPEKIKLSFETAQAVTKPKESYE